MSSLIDIMNAITSVTEQICDYVENNHPDHIQISILPAYTKQDESLDRHHLSINVTSSAVPYSTLRVALEKRFVDGEQSSRLLQRWPGIVVYNDAHEHLQILIRTLNELKDAFKLQVETIAKGKKTPQEQQFALSEHLEGEATKKVSASTLRDRKWELIHSTYSMLVTLYVYRKVPMFTGPFSSGYYSWLRAPNTRKISKTDLINHLEWQLNQAERSISSTVDTAVISHAISMAASSSRKSYIQRFSQPPRPNLVVRFYDERKPKAFYGSLPVFAFNQGGRPFTYKALKDFNDEALSDRKLRSDAKLLTPFYGNFYYGE